MAIVRQCKQRSMEEQTLVTPHSAALCRDWYVPLHYPDPAITILALRFAGYTPSHTPWQRLDSGTLWAEDPYWFGHGRFLVQSLYALYVETQGRISRESMAPWSHDFYVRRKG